MPINGVVPDNLKAGVTSPNLYEPDLNPTYQDFARHYGMAVVPARVRKPRDKAKVEVAIVDFGGDVDAHHRSTVVQRATNRVGRDHLDVVGLVGVQVVVVKPAHAFRRDTPSSATTGCVRDNRVVAEFGDGLQISPGAVPVRQDAVSADDVVFQAAALGVCTASVAGGAVVTDCISTYSRG